MEGRRQASVPLTQASKESFEAAVRRGVNCPLMVWPSRCVQASPPALGSPDLPTFGCIAHIGIPIITQTFVAWTRVCICHGC